MERTYAKDTPKMKGKNAFVQGWAHDLRNFGGLKFIILKDRTGKVQATLPKKSVSKELFNSFDEISKESVLYVKGKVQKSEKAQMGVEIIPSEIEIISKADAPVPLDISGKIESDLSSRLDHRFLDLRNRKSVAIFTIRGKVLKYAVEYFDSAGFININTPKLTTIGVETGAELFEVKYFDRKAYLAQSPQVYKQMFVAAGLERVYEIAPVYRAEKSRTSAHLTEFTGIDFEQGFIRDEHDVMDTVEGLFRHIFKRLNEECKEELTILERRLAFPKKIPRVTMKEAKEMLAKEKGFKLGAEEDLNLETQGALAEIIKKGWKSEFVFVYRYPFAIRPFYHMKPANEPNISMSFDLLWNGVEVATGSQREHRHEVLKRQAKDAGIDLDRDMKEYAEIFKYGCPPHGGTGLGLDRMVQGLLDIENIREVILLPRDPDRIAP